MQIWFDIHNNPPISLGTPWMRAKTAEEVMYLIRTFEYSTNPVTLISIEAATGADVVEELTWHGGTYQVVFHGGEPTPRMLTLVSQYNWDKPSMDNRTAELSNTPQNPGL